MKRPTQRERILYELREAGERGVRGDTFLGLNMPRYAARVKELRDQGFDIRTEDDDGMARYRLYEGAEWNGKPDFVEGEGDCWVWQGALDQGYGKINTGGRRVLVHRFFYESLIGPIPDGLQIDHLCRNRACVNPGHLEPVTAAENQRRGDQAKLTAEQVAAIRGSSKQTKVLAAEYGIGRSHVRKIRNGERWTDIPALPEPPRPQSVPEPLFPESALERMADAA